MIDSQLFYLVLMYAGLGFATNPKKWHNSRKCNTRCVFVVTITVICCFYLMFYTFNKNCFFQFVSFAFPHIAIDCFFLFFSISGACSSFSACDSADGGSDGDEHEDNDAAASLVD